MGSTWGELRVAAYDGKGRLVGLREAAAVDSTSVYNWYDWLGDPANQAAMQELTASPRQTTSDVRLGGSWSDFTRNGLGTLTQIDVDDDAQWTASTFANGPGLSQVGLEGLSGTSMDFPIEWDGAGRASSIDGHWFVWTGDDRLAQVTVGQPHGNQLSINIEEHFYDAFGRNVRIRLNDGATLDRVYAGAEVVKEVSDCAERTCLSGPPRS